MVGLYQYQGQMRMYEAKAHSSATQPLIAEALFVIVSLAKCAVCCKYLCTSPRLQGNI